MCLYVSAGNPEAIQLEATRLGLDLSKANIVNPAESPKLKEYSQACARTAPTYFFHLADSQL